MRRFTNIVFAFQNDQSFTELYILIIRNSRIGYPSFSKLDNKINNADCILRTADFFNTRSVFSLNEAAGALAPAGGRKGTVERLKYHLKTGRLKLVTRGIYAVVPYGVPVESDQPDPFLVAVAVRPDGAFSYHSALELQGAAHSVWMRFTLYVKRRRRPLRQEILIEWPDTVLRHRNILCATVEKVFSQHAGIYCCRKSSSI